MFSDIYYPNVVKVHRLYVSQLQHDSKIATIWMTSYTSTDPQRGTGARAPKTIVIFLQAWRWISVQLELTQHSEYCSCILPLPVCITIQPCPPSNFHRCGVEHAARFIRCIQRTILCAWPVLPFQNPGSVPGATVKLQCVTVSMWWHSTFYCHHDRLDTSAIQLICTAAGCWVTQNFHNSLSVSCLQQAQYKQQRFT